VEKSTQPAILTAMTMLTRFLLGGLQFFGIAAAVAIAVALLAPMDAMRFLGVISLACAGLGFMLHLYALQRVDPHAFMVLRSGARAAVQSIGSALSRVASILTGAAHSSSRTLR